MRKPILTTDALKKVLWVVIFSMVIIQVLDYLLFQVSGIGGNIRLGMGFMLLIVAGIVMVAFNLIMRQQKEDTQMSKINIVIMVLAVIALIFLLLNIKGWVPEIFEQAMFDLKSLIGM